MRYVLWFYAMVTLLILWRYALSFYLDWQDAREKAKFEKAKFEKMLSSK